MKLITMLFAIACIQCSVLYANTPSAEYKDQQGNSTNIKPLNSQGNVYERGLKRVRTSQQIQIEGKSSQGFQGSDESNRLLGNDIIDCVCESAYLVGDQVQLLVDNPDDSTLLTGATGTVVCGWIFGSTDRLLVRWDDWYDGHENGEVCDCDPAEDTGVLNCWFVNCDEIQPFVPGSIDCVCESAYLVGDQVELLVDNPDDSTLLTGATGTVVCGWIFGSTDRLLVRWDDWYDGHENGEVCDCDPAEDTGVLNCWFVNCDEIQPFVPGSIDCVCESAYLVGDQVELLVDNPDDGTLLTGATGTVVCGWIFGVTDRLLVRWDDWYDGHENGEVCDCDPAEDTGVLNCWFVNCDQIQPFVPGSDCAEDINGDGVVDVNDLLQLIAAWGICP